MPDSARYFVSDYPARPSTPFKMEIPAAVAGKRIRRFFATEAEAIMEGGRLTKQIREQGTQSLVPTDAGISTEKAVRLFNAQYQDYSKSHREKVEKVTRWMAEDLKGPLNSVTPLRCLEWFRGIDGVSTSRATVFRYARLFWNWCVKTDLIDKSPWRPVVCPDSTPKRNILTAAEMLTLLEADMSDYLRASLLLGGFAGVRTVEILRLRWEDVTAGQIYIGAEVAKQKKKGNRERLVDMTEPLKKRIKLFNKKRGPIVPVRAEEFYWERRELVKQLRKARKLDWKTFPENSLRHSFATYHLGRSNDPGRTAYQMGTSIQLVISTYAVPARRADWRSWWKI